jgi:hypothetical protein
MLRITPRAYFDQAQHMLRYRPYLNFFKIKDGFWPYSATGGLTKKSILVLDCCKAFMDSLPQIFMKIRIGFALSFVIPDIFKFVPLNDI